MGSVLNLPLACSTDPPHTRLGMRPPAHIHKMSSMPPPQTKKKKRVFSPFKPTPRSHQLQQPPQHRTDPPSTTPVLTWNRLRPTSIPDHPQLQPPPLGVQRKPTEQHVPQWRCGHDGVMTGKGGSTLPTRPQSPIAVVAAACSICTAPRRAPTMVEAC
ncbi:hypothetical protein EDB89DRAFT_1937263, partial [Lactarius sanguifluus]